MREPSRPIVNVFNQDGRRIGRIKGLTETKFFFFKKHTFCFEGLNRTAPAFYGWCKKIEDVHKFVKETFPYSHYGSLKCDKLLDQIERAIPNY